jgi:hypothetical protein
MDKSQIEKIIKKAEAEARITKPPIVSLSSKRSAFLNKGRRGASLIDASSPCIPIIDDTGNSSQPIAAFDPLTGQKVNMTVPFPSGWGGFYNLSGDISRYGNKLYFGKFVSGGSEIAEFEITTNNTLNLIRVIDFTNVLDANGNNITPSNSAAMKDANTMIIDHQSGSTSSLYSIDISVNTINQAQHLFDLQNETEGDICYIPSSNTVITSEHDVFGGGQVFRHYDMQGNLLNEIFGASATSTNTCLAMFCYNDLIYGCLSDFQNTYMHPIYLGPNNDGSTMSILPHTSSVPGMTEAAASDPSKCGSGDCDPPSGECYDIGDTGPEGGLIFAVPLGHPQNVGVNQSDYYYEVADKDVAISGTPNAGFNLTCGFDPITTTQTIPNMAVTGPILTVAGTYSVSVGDEITSLTPGLFPPGTTIASITPAQPGFTQFLASNPANFTGNYDIILTSQALVPGWSIIGSEWGAYNKQNIQTSNDFGFGQKNTDIIDVFQQTIPLSHPVLDTHDIAASLCKQQPGVSVATQYQTGFKDDWFLPSQMEFWWMNYNLGDPSASTYALSSYAANQLMLTTTPGQNSEHYYWTSSKEIPVNTPIPDEDKYAWAFNASTNYLELAYRCHTLSVRPIRRFKCKPEPCPTPPDCNFEYNYRDGLGRVDGGFLSAGGNIDGSNDPAQIHWNTTNEGCTPGTPPINLTTDSIIGGDELLFANLNRRDVLGNVHSDADFNNHTGYTISAWDTKYNFIGKWKYSTIYQFLSNVTHPNLPRYSYDRPGSDNYISLRLRDVQHLEGDYPVIYYAGKPDVPNSGGSHTAVFFKIEWDGNTGNYETGCNSTTFGNPHPYYSPGSGNGSNTGRDWPSYCGPLYLLGAYDRHVALPRYATFPPLDLNGSTLPVYPDVFTANPYLTPPFVPGFSPNSQPIGCDGVSVVTPIQNHCWSICSVFYNGAWYSVPDPWFGGEPYGPMAMENNPLGTTPPPFFFNPPIDQDYTDFYDWIINGNPTLTVGDSFQFGTPGMSMQINFTDSNGNIVTGLPIGMICFKYRGIQTYSVPLNIENNNFPLPYVFHNPPYSCCVSGGSSSSLMRPAENDPDSIKLKVNARTLSKRQSFIKAKQPKSTGPFGVFGYYPLYDGINDAIKDSPNSSYHIHEFNGQEYYMPEGLEMGKTQFHGDWKPITKTIDIDVEGVDPETDIKSLLAIKTDPLDTKSSKKDYK